MDNILTVDVEEWFYANALNIETFNRSQFETRVVQQTMRVLDVLDTSQTKATFFVLGCVAKNHPDLVRTIVKKGHRIGSHGHDHQLVYTQSDKEFRDDVRLSKEILETISGTDVLAYRAPSWSITKNHFHRLFILEEEGYKYDSSLQPFWTPLSGSNRTPVEPFHPIVDGQELKLIEIPPTILKFARLIPFPFSGGFYLRFMPLWLILSALDRVNRSRHGMVYVHPWEFDKNLPRIRTTMLTRFVQYFNISTTEIKVLKLLSSYSFKPLEEVVDMKKHFKKRTL